MEAELTVAGLKRKLLEEVRSLFHRNGSVWKEPILDVLHDLRRIESAGRVIRWHASFSLGVADLSRKAREAERYRCCCFWNPARLP